MCVKALHYTHGKQLVYRRCTKVQGNCLSASSSCAAKLLGQNDWECNHYAISNFYYGRFHYFFFVYDKIK
ncbi:hypothetical protein DAI22_06g066300 [Oryza sativa Japonica Group]|nr:hypothetical protein DAI22_06g066300 [Oryza sativa Japonica Group]